LQYCPTYYVDLLSQVALLRICNFEQALNACFPRKRCLDGTYVLTGSARLLLRVQTLHHLQRFVMHV